MGISTIISTQVYKSVAPTIRKNATNLIVFKLRNQGDMDALLEELTAISDRKTIQKIYNIATDEKHNFLYINLMAHNINEMFMRNFDTKLIIKS